MTGNVKADSCSVKTKRPARCGILCPYHTQGAGEMSDKSRFAFLLRPIERRALERLAQLTERSQGGTLRYLIRQEARRQGVWPATPYDLAPADHQDLCPGQGRRQ